MSKFFDQTQRAQDWSGREGLAKKLDIAHVLDSVKDTIKVADSVGVEMSEHRLDRCRKFVLPRPEDGPTLIAHGDANQVAAEAYRTLRTRLVRLQTTSGIRSVVFSSAVPGEGKTLTTLNTGICCAQLHEMRVLVIDGDLRTRGLSKLIGSPSGPGLSDILAGRVQYHDAILSTDQPNLYVLPGGSPAGAPPELFAGEHWKEFLGWAGETFKLILVDAPPILGLSDFDLMATGCDGVLTVVRANQTKRQLLRKAATQIDPKKNLGVIFNATQSDVHKSYYHAYYSGSGNGHQK
ncbi:MAG: CpsD/CapB family tyrosine-protein kinase [Candidatus Acidiferrales bacterium]